MFDKHERVTSILKEHAASFIREEASSSPLITVTSVSISSDYNRATIFVTTIPDDGEENALIFLKRKAGQFRDYLKKHAKLRSLPHIEFAIDRGERHRQHMDEVVRDIEKNDKYNSL